MSCSRRSRASTRRAGSRPLEGSSCCATTALAALDPAIFDRPKAGFVLPIDTWARTAAAAPDGGHLGRSRPGRPRRPSRRLGARRSGAPSLRGERGSTGRESGLSTCSCHGAGPTRSPCPDEAWRFCNGPGALPVGSPGPSDDRGRNPPHLRPGHGAEASRPRCLRLFAGWAQEGLPGAPTILDAGLAGGHRGVRRPRGSRVYCAVR